MQRSKGKQKQKTENKPNPNTKQANQRTTPKTPQPSKIPLLQVKQVKRVRRNPHRVSIKLVNEELVRGKLSLPTNEHGKNTMESNTIAVDGQDPVNDQANQKQATPTTKTNQTNKPKTTKKKKKQNQPINKVKRKAQ